MAGFIKFATKCGIAGGVVYGISTLDLFSSQDRTISTFRRLESKTKENVPADYIAYIPKLPSSLTVQQKWNAGVQSVFRTLEKAPDAATDMAQSTASKSKEFIQKQLKS